MIQSACFAESAEAAAHEQGTRRFISAFALVLASQHCLSAVLQTEVVAHLHESGWIWPSISCPSACVGTPESVVCLA